MGINSAIRMLVHEVKEIVAEEVRAQVGARDQQVTGPDRSSVGRTGSGVPAPQTRDSMGQAVASARGGAEQHLPRAPADPTQPNFDAAEAAWFLRYPTIKAFYHAVRRYGIPHSRKGERSLLFKRADLEKFVASRSRHR